MLGHDLKMSCAKLQGNRFRIDGEIVEKHAILVNLTASIYVRQQSNVYSNKTPKIVKILLVDVQLITALNE